MLRLHHFNKEKTRWKWFYLFGNRPCWKIQHECWSRAVYVGYSAGQAGGPAQSCYSQAKLSRCSWCTSTPAFHAGDHHMLVPVYKIFHQGRYWVVCYMVTYTSRAVAVSHDQVECSTSLTPVAVHTAAAVMKNLLTQVCTLLSLLLKQQVAKLKKITVSGIYLI